MRNLRTNTTIELVGYGHPDRFADYIGELVLTKHLEQDKNAKVALEVLATRNSISLGGEITSNAKVNYDEIVYFAIEKVYGEKWWPNFKETKVFNHIELQSQALANNQKEKIVAGDQGVIYGYYDVERFTIINNLYELMNQVRKNFDIATDWKLLFDTEKNELSMSVCGQVDHNKIKDFIMDKWNNNEKSKTIVIVNPKGEWLTPGPLTDTGVIGRKLMIDTFGAGVPHGGGAFCGKDPSKVDKTGIIIGSYLAKEAAKYRNTNKALVELNYKIGDELPKAYAYFEDGEKIDITDNVNLTLDQYIKTYDLLNEDWSKYVLKGGILSYLHRNK